jgi:hypothetical protein
LAKTKSHSRKGPENMTAPPRRVEVKRGKKKNDTLLIMEFE